MTPFIDTHAHLDGEEFLEDLPLVIKRAQEAGVQAIFIPAIDRSSIGSVMALSKRYPRYCYPMIGLQPEEVGDDWQEVLHDMKQVLERNLKDDTGQEPRYIAIGECGLDFYWTREHEHAQLLAFEEQVQWSVEYQLPLMIHCRKAQNEMLHIMRNYAAQLPGGVFHCFTGNCKEAEEFLRMERFCLGVGGVSTFKSSRLREDLPASVPLDRLVLETDSPYMAPVPHRGKRNESAFLAQILHTLAEAYQVSSDQLATITNDNVHRIFGI